MKHDRLQAKADIAFECAYHARTREIGALKRANSQYVDALTRVAESTSHYEALRIAHAELEDKS